MLSLYDKTLHDRICISIQYVHTLEQLFASIEIIKAMAWHKLSPLPICCNFRCLSCQSQSLQLPLSLELPRNSAHVASNPVSYLQVSLKETLLEIDLRFHSLTSICSLSLSLSLSLWFYSFTLLNGVLKSLPRHKLFTTAQPTKARKQINIRAGNGQLLPRTEWSDLSRYILRLFQYLSTSFRCVSKMQSSCWRGHTNHTTWRKTDPQSCSACQSLLFYLRSTFAR